MKKIALSFLPLMLAGFFIPGENCGTVNPQATKFDGPYVLYKNNQIYVKYILDERGNHVVQSTNYPDSDRAKVVLSIPADEAGKSFTVQLKDSLQPEASEFPSPEKMYILSDIEGNFPAFRKLLIVGGIMDSSYNWTFGSGHLVLTGDFVDRGSQVTEVLWLIYMLEGKAKAAGGYVHFILGNHEIMNMSGDLRYVQPKYIESASLLNEPFTSLIGEQTEIGRWLRTKNVVEKIGDILFTHGGISRNVNHMALTVPAINQLARPYYGDSSYKYSDKRLDTLYGDTGPFWYRGYYMNDKIFEKGVIDSTLSLYNIGKIATGHTVIADTISFLYDGKVINTDVHHVRGHSEAVLIENGKFYRVLPTGENLKYRIKICCIASPEEARMAIYEGADALGLVGRMPSGPGPIPDELIASIARTIHPPISSFLLTCEQTAKGIIDHVSRVYTGTVQIVDELIEGSYADIRKALPHLRIVQVIHVTGEDSLEESMRIGNEVDAILLDSGNPKAVIKTLGGTGNKHDWSISRKIVESVSVPVFLAGGLNPENVEEAIKIVGPFGVDVCSGVRTNGKLDRMKLQAFINAVHNI